MKGVSKVEPLPDGLVALQEVVSLGEIMAMIAKTARWVAPETFKLLPVWYPEYSRKSPYYNANWSVPRRTSKGSGEQKLAGNSKAADALTQALGLTSKLRENWACCHIWSIDDPRIPNVVVQDHRFFSCVGNMVLLPSPLKAFTDIVPGVKGMLRACATNLYGWRCDHVDIPPSDLAIWVSNAAYPKSWPHAPGDPPPPGTAVLSDPIRCAAARRIEAIRRDLDQAGEFYPRDEVKRALEYWKIKV